MPNYVTDDKWRFDYEYKKLKKKVDSLERKIYWLEDYKKKQQEKEYRDKHKKC